MARTASNTSTGTKTTRTKTAANQNKSAATESSVAAVSDAADVDMDKEVDNVKTDSNVEEEKIEDKPLEDSDEIEVMALVPHVSYKDPYTSDFYEWDDAGQIEIMPYDSLVRMRRNHRSYFDNMWLKPEDDRVIKKFGLAKLYDKNDFLMDDSSYTVDNIDEIVDAISSIKSNDAKNSIINKVKDMVASSKITNINVIRSLEKAFDIDLVSSI